MKMPTKLEMPKRSRSAKKKATAGPDAREARRQAVAPEVKSTAGLSTGPVANPKCALPESIRIVVVDDHPLFRHGLIQLLNSDDGFAVCGEAASAGEGMEVIRKTKPHLVIADLGLKGTNGIELTKMIVAEFPQIPVLILSMHDESLYAVRSLRAGARGYVTKQEALGSVLEAVREVMDGRTYLSPKMASQVISKVVVNRVAPDEEEAQVWPRCEGSAPPGGRARCKINRRIRYRPGGQPEVCVAGIGPDRGGG